MTDPPPLSQGLDPALECYPPFSNTFPFSVLCFVVVVFFFILRMYGRPTLIRLVILPFFPFALQGHTVS